MSEQTVSSILPPEANEALKTMVETEHQSEPTMDKLVEVANIVAAENTSRLVEKEHVVQAARYFKENIELFVARLKHHNKNELMRLLINNLSIGINEPRFYNKLEEDTFMKLFSLQQAAGMIVLYNNGDKPEGFNPVDVPNEDVNGSQTSEATASESSVNNG